MALYDLDDMTLDELEELSDEITYRMNDMKDEIKEKHHTVEAFCKEIAKTGDLFVADIELPQGVMGSALQGVLVYSRTHPDKEPIPVVFTPRDLEHEFSQFVYRCLEWFGLPTYLYWRNT